MGGFLTLSPEFCFVIEDGCEITGYALAAVNAKQFQQKLKMAWIPEMCLKYPDKQDDVDDRNMTPPQVRDSIRNVLMKHCIFRFNNSLPYLQEMIRWFHSFTGDDIFPNAVQAQHPSVMCASLLPKVTDQSIAKRLIICLLAALRANGEFYAQIVYYFLFSVPQC